MGRFDNKTVLVTGGAAGIGAATARRIAREGGRVVIADYAREEAAALATQLGKRGADALAVYFSATDLESCHELVQTAGEKYGRIDVLVNNVGGTDLRRDTDVAQLDIGYFDEVFHLNLRYALYLIREAVPWMEKGGGGSIVNVASIGGVTGDFRGTCYGAAKAGMINMTRYAATQLGRKNIRCNAVAPGLILTPAAARNLPPQMQQVFIRHNVLPRLGEPEDVAAAIAFLASDDAAYVTGQTLVVDGGLTIHNPTVADLTEGVFK